MKAEKPIEYAVVVYQADIANLFSVDCLNTKAAMRTEKRLYQGSFSRCEDMARGLAMAGIPIASMACNMAGDIARQNWSNELAEQPFAESFSPVWNKVEPTFYFGQ